MTPNQWFNLARKGAKYLGSLQAVDGCNIAPEGVKRLDVPAALQTAGATYKRPMDIGEVRGQQQAKQALLVAAAGRHNILLSGPPGEGKSFLIKTMPGFMPPPSTQEREELQAIYSLASVPLPIIPADSRLCAGLPDAWIRPYREVGPRSTETTLLGGGRSQPIPGDLPLAHSGILFLDELPQFGRQVIDSMRQPLNDGYVKILRNGVEAKFPANVQFVAAMNPCPCGYLGSIGNHCTCREQQIKDYQSAISGPILDRIDIFIRLNRVSGEELFSPAVPNQSQRFLYRVLQAQCLAMRRQGKLNNELEVDQIADDSLWLHQSPESKGVNQSMMHACGTGVTLRGQIGWTEQGLRYFQIETDKPTYSNRKRIRLAKVCRTIADLYGCPGILPAHIQKAVEFTELPF